MVFDPATLNRAARVLRSVSPELPADAALRRELAAQRALSGAAKQAVVRAVFAYFRWRKRLESEPRWSVPEEERRLLRRYLMLEVHVAAMIPLFAVVMARGLAR